MSDPRDDAPDIDAIIAELDAQMAADLERAANDETEAPMHEDADGDADAGDGPDELGERDADDVEGWRAEAPDEDDLHIAPRLWPTVQAALEEREWRYEMTGDTAAFARVRGQAANYEVFVATEERLEILRCWVMLPVRVPEERRSATAELLNHLNYHHVAFGHLEFDPDDGQLHWLHTIDVEGGLLGTTMVQNVVSAGLAMCDRTWAAIVAVAFADAVPLDAVRLVEPG